MPRAREREPGFEESLSSLEKIVAQLESGDLPLERALELFEEGIELSRRCQKQLEEAERKVELLLQEHGEIKTIPFNSAREEKASGGKKIPPSADFGSGVEENGVGMEGEEGEEDLDESIPF